MKISLHNSAACCAFEAKRGTLSYLRPYPIPVSTRWQRPQRLIGSMENVSKSAYLQREEINEANDKKRHTLKYD